MKTVKCDMDSACFFGEIHSACSDLISSLTRQDNEAAFLLIAVRNKEKDSDDSGESEYFGTMQKYDPKIMERHGDSNTSESLAKATAGFLIKQRLKFMFEVLEEIIKGISFDNLITLSSMVLDEKMKFERGYK